jgi:hypothetical protein
MNLFELKNNKLVFAPVALSIAPYKKLYDNDSSKHKEKATAELAAIYYFIDYKSDFSNILEENAKLHEIISILPDLGKDWKPYQEWNDAVDYYKKMQETPSLKLISSARNGLAKIEKFFNAIDLQAVDKSGKPKYSAKQLLDTINQVPKAIESMNMLEEQIKKEIEQKNNKLRGGRTKGAFVD